MKLKPVTINTAALRYKDGKLPNAVQALWCMADELHTPIGFIWYRQILVDHIEILYVFVHERARRQRIGSKMVLTLFSWYPKATVCTALANELSEPWLKHMGFEQRPYGWFLKLK